MGRKKVLMACSNYWTSPFQVGSHQLARGFVRAGWDVAFVSDPISPLHILAGMTSDLRARFRVYRQGGASDLAGHLWTYVPAAPITPHNKPLLRGQWLHRHWARYSLPNVAKVAARHGFGEVDLLYFDNAQQLFWRDAVQHKMSVLRVADNQVGYPKSTPASRALEEELARSVDLVVYTAASLRPHVANMSPKRMFHLPNGVNFQHFADGPNAMPREYEALPKPIAVYVGAMDTWFDFALVNQAAEALPHVSFVLIGPDHLARSSLKDLPNVHLLGRRPYDSLPGYLHNADVGLIPFDVWSHPELVHGINPLKLYEYLACGLPVVAVEWQELQHLASPAVLAKTPAQFIQAIRETLAQPRDRTLLRAYAERADWQGRVRDLIAQLDG